MKKYLTGVDVDKSNVKKCKHTFICDAGYGRKRCVFCDAVSDISRYTTDDSDGSAVPR